MKCNHHPTVDTIGECVRCHTFVCSQCQVTWEGATYCITCIDEILGSEARIRLQQKAIPRKKEKAGEPEGILQDKVAVAGRKPSKRAAITAVKRLPKQIVKPGKGVLTCPHCGYENAEDVIYCRKCATQLKRATRNCTQCSSVVPAAAIFCRVCGSKQ